MLDSLYIKNIALIRELNIEFPQGFTVFTGETGAGKSIIIDSIGVLLGRNKGKELIRSGEDSASVSGIISSVDSEKKNFLSSFGLKTDDDNCLLIQKDININGKNTVRFNSRPLTSSLQKEIMPAFAAIHGQKDGHTIFNANNQIKILDSFSDDPSLCEEYSSLYNKLKQTEKALALLEKSDSERLQRADMLDFQINEIKSAKLKTGEREELLEKKKRLLADEKIRKYTSLSYRAIYSNEKGMSSCDLINKVLPAIEYLEEYFPLLIGSYAKLEEIVIELTDIAERIKDASPDYDTDPNVLLDKIESRLDTIERLLKKYGKDETSVLEYLAIIQKELEDSKNSSELIEEYKKQLSSFEKECRLVAEKIHSLREVNAERISKEVCDRLSFLDMPKVRFKIEVKDTKKLLPDGSDEVCFLISPNPGEPLLPIDKTASGGELSRIMLAIKCVLAEKDKIPTIIFDEIDTGVSGKTSRKIGIALKELSKSAQVICITHSPQIASLADTHIKISKSETNGRTETTIKTLSKEERVEEIARILGGIEVTDTQRKTALELIEGV